MKLLPKLLGSSVAVGVIIMASTGALIYSSAGNAIEQVIGANQTNLAEEAMDRLDRFMYERRTTIQNLSQYGQLRSYIARPTPTSAAEASQSLQSIKITDAAWEDVSILDTAGKTLLSSATGSQKADLLKLYPELRKAYTDAMGGEPGHTDAFLSSVSGEPTVAFTAPIRMTDAKRTIIGAVVGELSWPAASELLTLHGQSKVYLFNRDGYVLGTSTGLKIKPMKDSYQTNEAVSHVSAKEGGPRAGAQTFPSLVDPSVPMLTSYALEKGYFSYSGNSWFLVLQTPANEAFAPAQGIVATILIVVALTLLLGIGLLLFLLTRQIIRPIRLLQSATTAIAQGNLRQQIPVRSDDEVGQLAKLFNRMSDRLDTASTNLVQEKARLLASINSLPIGFILTDAKGEVLTMNTTMTNLLDPHSLSGNETADQDKKKAAQAFRDKLLKRCRAVIQDKEAVPFEQAAVGPQIFRSYIAPVVTTESHKEQAIGSVVLVEDITEAKVMERSKDEFFSIASHELRTPLTAIKGNASMMLQYYAEALKDPSLKQMTEDIHTSSIRLIEIVNDFLDTSRLEQGKIKFKLQPTELDKIIEQVIYEMGPLLQQKHLYIKTNEATKRLGSIPLVLADPDRAKQVIYNLVGNAAKFTEEGGITIVARPEGKMVKITVTDTGRGISVEGRKLLFHKFQQAGASLLTRDTTRGTGLGLYISRLLVEGMNGRIGLEESEPGVGTVFSFTLPIAPAGARVEQAEAPAVLPATPVQGAKAGTTSAPVHPRILVFEDDPYVQRMYQRLFALEDWEVELAPNGEHGVEKAANGKPSLILLDLMMPKVDGMILLGQLKKTPETKDIPVLVLTNIGESDTIAEAKRLGAIGYLIKADFTPEQLLEEVKKYLRNS